jgi:Protein of unknown function (DUF2442)
MPATEVNTATGMETTPEALILVLADRRVSIPWEKCSAKLARATPAERNRAELSPGGYGVHWPLLDEDLSVTGLLHSA